MSDDKFIAESEKAELEAHRNARAANLFDVRRFIGGLFVLYGVILLVLGLGASDADVEKAAGVNVNLWTGVAMLLVGAFFLAWAFMRPLAQQLDEDEPGEGDRTVKAAPAPVGVDAAALRGSQTTSRRSGRDRGGPGGGSEPGSKQA
jgi:hypothetical protein